MKLSKEIFIGNNSRDLYIAAAYIPPENSTYYKQYDCNLFSILESDIESYQQLGNIIVVGDLNGRIGNADDYIVNDNINGNVLDVLNNVINYTPDTPTCARKACDQVVNTFGRDLLNMCVATSLRVVNGRLGEDKFTFYNANGSSVNDYLLTTSGYFSNIYYFTISDFNEYSDHAALTFSISNVCKTYDDLINPKSQPQIPTKIFRWDPNHTADVKNAVLENIISLTNLVDNCDKTKEDLNECVERFSSRLSEILEPFCSKTVTYSHNRTSELPINKPWFDNKCSDKYKTYKQSLHTFNKNRSPANRLDLCSKKTAYKKTIRMKKRQYSIQEGDSMENLRKSNPKLFYRKFKKREVTNDCSLGVQNFFEHFQNLAHDNTDSMDTQHVDTSITVPNADSPVFENLDEDITLKEVEDAILRLKRNKSPGMDNILNEYFIENKSLLVPILHKLFNNIFSSGFFPEIWSQGIIIPIFKKGDVNSTDNYRGISLMSNLGKIFTGILNSRLLKWSEENCIISDAQFGFKPGYGTTDCIFVLNHIINKTLSLKKKLYCCFIDYQKAFDKIEHANLWQKLTQSGITGKLLNIVKNMYQQIKSRIRFNNTISEIFEYKKGVIQGESLSPLLFSLYINDLESHLMNNGCSSVEIEDINLFLFMYADDTVLLAESPEDLQFMMNSLQSYCDKWSITVNVKKSKVMVFQSRKVEIRNEWKLNNNTIGIVDNFNYLGITLNFNGKYSLTQKTLAKQGRKSLFLLRKNMRDLYLNTGSLSSVFDTYVGSVVSYGCEIWGFHPAPEIEKLHIEFCKQSLNVGKKAMNLLVYNELGRLPLHIIRKIRIIKYWLKLRSSNNIIMRACYNDMISNIDRGNWLTCVRRELQRIGLGNIWFRVDMAHDVLMNIIKQRFSDTFLQSLFAFVDGSPKCQIYKHLTEPFGLKTYLTLPIVKQDLSYITKYRISAHKLNIETGRYHNIERQHRTCVCNPSIVEDEYHFILICPLYTDLRQRLIKKYYYTRPSAYKLITLFNCTSIKQMRNFGKYLRLATDQRNNI